MSDNASSSSVNPDLKVLHQALAAQVDTLSDQLMKATDDTIVTAILREIDEVTHRLVLVGGLLMTQQTARITQQVDKVRAATKDLNASINKIDDATTFIKDIASFLTLVDKAIDLAKLVIP